MSSIKETIAKLRRTLVRRGASPEDAEDFVQEAYLRLQQKQEEVHIETPEAYVVRSAINIATDEARRVKRWRTTDQSIEDLPLADKSPRADEVLASRKRLQRLSAGFEALDPTTRAIVTARKLEGLKMAKIAERQNLSLSAVEKRLVKGMIFLAAWMEDQ